MTRRQEAIAFCASVSTWVAIWTGPTSSPTRNAKAMTVPIERSPATPSMTPAMITPPLARPPATPADANVTETSFWALTLARRLVSMPWSTRRWVRSSIACERTTDAPTTGSAMTASISPTVRRTVS